MDVIEVYIRCTTCNWESVLRKSTMEIEHLMANERKLIARGRSEEIKHGTINGNTNRLLLLVRREMAVAKREAKL